MAPSLRTPSAARLAVENIRRVRAGQAPRSGAPAAPPTASSPLDPKAQARFWKYVRTSPGCWEWASATRKGYGVFWVGKIGHAAHRVAWELANGRPPAELLVLHKCDNRRCVRPDHLFLGTYADNAADMVAKGRHRPQRGEASHKAKLTTNQVAHVRLLAHYGLRNPEIARRFGVSTTTIWDIVRGRSWKAA